MTEEGCGWPEVDVAVREARREVKLCGGEAARRVQASGGVLPPQLFALPLNLLTLTELQLERLPAELDRLKQLRSLLVFNTGLLEFPKGALRLPELSVLDLSRNQIPTVPELSCLSHLSTINMSGNQLEHFPSCLLPKLLLLDLSHNRLAQFPDVCRKENSHLADLKLNSNCIADIPAEVSCLPALKNLDLGLNQIKLVPKELSEIPRLKDINLKGNKLNDNRLLKLVDQCRSKQIIEYIRQTCPKASSADLNASGKISKKNIKKQQQKKNESADTEETEDGNLDNLCDKMYVLHCSDDIPNVKIIDSVKAIRPHIVCCIVRGLSFTEETFKKFIQMQTKLHDTVCEKRHAATIATHDLQKIPPGDLLYTAKQPFSIVIQPLNRAKTYSGLELYSQLRKEAEDLRKEKKRNVYSGIHKYLYLLEGKSLYPCLQDSAGNTISFPPITNSDVTKMSHETTSMIVEVTSSQNQTICRKVLDMFLIETLNMGVGGRSDGDEQLVNNRLGTSHKLQIQQMKIVDFEGKMKVIYPSKVDLFYEEKNNLKIIRE